MSIAHPRAHSYDSLILRWRKVARRSKLTISPFANASSHPLFVIRSRSSETPRPCIYLSAGVHGDEPAATEALVTWAECNPEILERIQLTIFPCMNPWGLINNSRLDESGRDLNRLYNTRAHPIAAQIRQLRHERYALALTLHEDFEAPGIYIYEVASAETFWAEKLLAAASKHISIDSRTKIEGREATYGVIRSDINLATMVDWPEAFLLHVHHAARTFTIETPSEFHIDDRVKAHVAVINAALALTLASPKK